MHKQYYIEKEKVDRLVARKNQKTQWYNGIYDRYEYPVLTREFAPVHWRYDLDEKTNPNFQERLGINAVMNSGAIKLNGKYYLVGDVSNVVFTNGAIADEDGTIYIYYASCDTRMHVATTTIDKMEDYLFNTPEDPKRSPDCVKQRCELIAKNLEILKAEGEK